MATSKVTPLSGAQSRRVPINGLSSVERFAPSGSPQAALTRSARFRLVGRPVAWMHDTVDDGHSGGRIKEHLEDQRANGILVPL